MSIEKMEFVTIIGLMKHLDRALSKCVESGYFHIADAAKEAASEGVFVKIESDNPYKSFLKRLISIDTGNGFSFQKSDSARELVMTKEEMESEISRLEKTFKDVTGKISECSNKITQRKQILTQLSHLKGMKFDFQKLFECTHIIVRFGRLPCESSVKLSYYDDRTFIFVPYDDDGTYQWGFYFAPADSISDADNIFRSLYFEIIKIPEYVKETPEKEDEILKAEIKKLEEELSGYENEQNKLISENAGELNELFSFLK